MAITWGANTTHTFGAPAPTPGAPPAFGSPAPAPGGGIFGSTSAPASAFGAPAPAPFGGGFGSPAPAGGTSLFGASPAPAPGSSGLFGSTPAPSGGMFGTPSTTSLFGAPTPAPSAFGSTSSSSFYGAPSGAPTPQQQQQIPAQAALQAHMDASARQEAERVRSALERHNAAYAGTPLPSAGGGEEAKFVAIVYNPMSPEQRQLQWLQGMGNGCMIPSPDRPPQVSEKQWRKAVVENPDPQNYVPQAMVGASALQMRINWQQDRAKELASHAATLHKSQETIRDRSMQAQQDVEGKVRRHAALRKRLLDVMKRVELARCMNQPTQPDELKVLQRLSALHKEVESVRNVLISLQDKARTQSATATKGVSLSAVPDTSQLVPVLRDQREMLQKLTTTAQRDQRDVALIQKRAAGNVPRSY